MHRSGDAGLTLVELLISASLLVVALTMFGGSLVTSQKLQVTDSQYSRANDQAQLAFQAIDRQIRSGYVVGATTVSGADAAVRIYSDAGGTPKCIAWVVADGDPAGKTGIATLYTTSWDAVAGTMPSFPSTGWTAMATDLWNWLIVPQVEPFDVPTPPTNVLKTLNVFLRLNATQRADATVELTSSFTSRNVERANEKIDGSGPMKSSKC